MPTATLPRLTSQDVATLVSRGYSPAAVLRYYPAFALVSQPEQLASLPIRGYSPAAVALRLPTVVIPPRPDPNSRAETLARLHAQELRTALALRLSRESIDRVERARQDRQIAAKRKRGRAFGALVVLSLASGAVILAEYLGNYAARVIEATAGASGGGRSAIVVAVAESVRWMFTGCTAGVALAVIIAVWMNSSGER